MGWVGGRLVGGWVKVGGLGWLVCWVGWSGEVSWDKGLIGMLVGLPGGDVMKRPEQSAIKHQQRKTNNKNYHKTPTKTNT